MKKIYFFILTMVMTMQNATAEQIKLPEPEKTNAVMMAMNNRHSTKKFQAKDIDLTTLSNVLWAAYGVNDASGKRTIPTARNEKNLQVYVATKKGTYLYDADKNELEQILKDDILDVFATQPYMTNVPVVLIYTADKNDPNNFGEMHAGSAYQNVALYATTVGLGTVVRGLFDKEKTAKLLKLPENIRVITTQAIGWPEK